MSTEETAGSEQTTDSGHAAGATGQTTGSRLDGFVGHYAARAAGMTASEIRALFAVVSRPEVVSLAGGMPSLTALPMDAVGDTLAELVRMSGLNALQYGSAQGDERLRAQICDVMRLEGIMASPDDVVVTVGSQQALDLVTRIFVDPGDVILAEAPSYVGALATFASYQARVVHVDMDDDGLVPDRLRIAIEAAKASGRHPKFLYTIPNFHNPAGISLSVARRREVLAICRQEGVLVLEDNPYGLLGFDGEPVRALRADDGEGVIYLGSFSKTFAPGFRVGWAVAPHGVREKLVLAAEATDLCPPAFSQMAVSAYLATQPWMEQIKTYRELYRERSEAMLSALTELMPSGVTWTRPSGGFYVWVRFPATIDTKKMLPRAVTARVAYVPGTAFYSNGLGRSFARLSFCYPTPERIVEGVRRLAGVVRDELDLRSTFNSWASADRPTAQLPDSPAAYDGAAGESGSAAPGRAVRDRVDAPGPDAT